MNTNDTRQNAHKLIDRVFLHLLPALGMAERPEQVRLSHLMLDALLGGSIALCDAGTGIGKTYAYLAAGTAFLLSRAAEAPIIISTSSIALQNAVRSEYLPILSAALLADGIIEQPMRSVIRKGKSHYVCPKRLERRLGQLDLSKKNRRTGAALLSLRKQLDMDGAAHLSSYDRARVCVSKDCECAHCDQEQCSYLGFLEDCESGDIQFQICNHNLLLADAIHRSTGRKPILPDACAVVIDEAHKLPETARQMFGTTLESGDIHDLIDSLRRERFLLAAESLGELSGPLLRLMAQPFDGERYYNNFARLLLATGAAWEGFDFPGDCVSLLVIPRLPSIATATYQSYSIMMKARVIPYFTKSAVLLGALTPQHIEEFYQTILNDGCTTNTVIHYHAIIRKALQSAVKKDILAKNPADQVDRPKKNVYHGSFYSEGEMLTLFDAIAGDPLELCVKIAAYYGLRRSEVLGLRWNAIDFERKTISISHKVIEMNVDGKFVPVGEDVLKTKSSFRTLPLISAVEELLVAEKERQAKNRRLFKGSYCRDYLDYICVDEGGKLLRPNYVTEHFGWILRKYGLRKIRFHDIRHTCASLLLSSGVPMKQIQIWLGHSTFSTTADIYAHLDFSAQEQSAAAMSGMFQRKEVSAV